MNIAENDNYKHTFIPKRNAISKYDEVSVNDNSFFVIIMLTDSNYLKITKFCNRIIWKI